jgi:hypothetical protein
LTALFTFFVLLSFISDSLVSARQNVTSFSEVTNVRSDTDSIKILHQIIDPDEEINYTAFKMAYSGYTELKSKLKLENSHILTIIDYSRPSVEKRLYVIDLKNKRILHNSLVAHGMNSGANLATKFSNKSGSLQSSLGFYTTGNTYHGKHGYSLKLTGVESGINDNAYKRAIVIHGANYATERFIKKNGRLGRSWGCPALPPHLSKSVIDTIKDGSFLFIYHDNPDYINKSKIVGRSDL